MNGINAFIILLQSKNCAEIEIVSGLLKSLKEDFTSTAERVLQLFNRFVIEESLR